MSEFRARERQRIGRLLAHLSAESVPPSVDLTEATALPGWLVQRDRSDGWARYSVWTPEDRPASVPWAHPPCSREGDRSWLLDLLRELWLPAAREFLADAALSMSDDEIEAAIRAEGREPAEVAAEIRRRALETIRRVEEERGLDAQRNGSRVALVINRKGETDGEDEERDRED